MASITRIYTFDAAHQLPNHKGKCANLHGHTYRLEVTLSGPIRPGDSNRSDAGFVVDFADLDEFVKPVLIQYLDHQYLNSSIGPDVPSMRAADDLPDPVQNRVPRTTAELIGCWIFGALSAKMRNLNSYEVRIRLWETPNSFVDVTAIDWMRSGKPGLV